MSYFPERKPADNAEVPMPLEVPFRNRHDQLSSEYSVSLTQHCSVHSRMYMHFMPLGYAQVENIISSHVLLVLARADVFDQGSS